MNQLVMTTTDELFLPSRIIYRVRDGEMLVAKFRRLRSMYFETPNQRWTWNYEFEATQFGFPAAYEKIPRERQPVVLATCHLIGAQWACCDNPMCDCGTLHLHLAPYSGFQRQGAVIGLTIHVEEERIEAETDADAEEVAQALSARFTPGDWLEAQAFYRDAKADASEPEDVEDLEAVFPEDVLRDPSLLMMYGEVFPHARTIHFERHQKLWFVRERYCSNPDCPCTDVLLQFLSPSMNVSGKQRIVREAEMPAVRFNFKNGDCRLDPKGPAILPAADWMAALRAACPELDHRIERRHRVLQLLHAKARQKRRFSVSTPIRREVKVGRNEPCPCGSGKKIQGLLRTVKPGFGR